MNSIKVFFVPLFVTVLSTYSSYAQKDLLQGINFGGEIGISKLITEFPKGQSGTINEFDNKPGIAYDFQLTKYLSPYWEVGTGFTHSVLKGHSENPQFSAEGINNEGMIYIGEINDPVDYRNRLIGQDFFIRFYFKRVDNQDHFNVIPFLKVGAGYINYLTELKYTETGEVVPGTEKEVAQLTTGIFKTGGGFKSYLSPRFNLIASVDFDFVNYDYLDVVHNYDDNGERLGIIGFCTELKIGLYFNVTQFEAGKGRKKKFAILEYQPFSKKK